MLQQVLLVIHVLLSVAIVALVLLQRGKGADAGAVEAAIRKLGYTVSRRN